MNKIRNVNQTSPSGAHVAEAPNTADKPNFIIILVDDMGYAGVSCFGNPYFKPPEIDRLAAEGNRFPPQPA